MGDIIGQIGSGVVVGVAAMLVLPLVAWALMTASAARRAVAVRRANAAPLNRIGDWPDRADAKAAARAADAASAEPVPSSRLARIGARPPAQPEAAEVAAVAGIAGVALEVPLPVARQEEAEAAPPPAPPAGGDSAPAAIDLTDPACRPASPAELAALLGALDHALTQPWPDQLIAADDAAAGCAITVAAAINSAARDQAADVVAAVREAAAVRVLDAEDMAAVVEALAQIEWMALIAQDGGLTRRTLPLTRHDPAAPLWVADAVAAMRAAATPPLAQVELAS